MDSRTEGHALSLTADEQALLTDVLSTSLVNLRGEVYKTEDYDYRQALKSRELLLRGILDRLTAPVI